MLIWGGANDLGLVDYGLAYDPAADEWTPIYGPPVPEVRVRHTAVWTGARMVVLGGDPAFSRFLAYATAYDPESDSWDYLPPPSDSIDRTWPGAVWTGHEVIVWGGLGGGSFLGLNAGDRFDFETRTWLPTSGSDGPIGRSSASAVWTGNELLVWGGVVFPYNRVGSGDRFDATLGTWSPMAVDYDLQPRSNHTAVWTGKEMIVWGGYSNYALATNGGRYDVAADSWTIVPTADGPSMPRDGHTAVWTGSEMIVWGGYSSTGLTSEGGRYDPTTGSWGSMSHEGAPEARNNAGAVVLDGRMMVWGGFDANSGVIANGAIYDSTLDAWSPVSSEAAPEAGAGFAMVAANGRAIVWGGRGANEASVNTGSVYDPSADRWTPLSTTGAPDARQYPAAEWTGHEMVVWGGWDSPVYAYDVFFDTGGRYDPLSDSWKPTTRERSPLGRSSAAAAWTGSEMLVWGGYGGATLTTGGAYSACAPDLRPHADAGPDQVLECTSPAGATALLDGSSSTDPDSSPGTNDDIASYDWTESGSSIATGAQASVQLALGKHTVTLTVRDHGGLSDSDDTLVTVQDTAPPVGRILAPSEDACFGPSAIPVVVSDDFTDVCDPSLERSYDPPGGPAYASHGDHDVTLTVSDASGNASRDERRFTIDLVPPVVTITSPASGGAILPGTLPLSIVFASSDDDGASGDVVHELIRIQGCVAFDGATYGNRDGLLRDETIVLNGTELCRIATTCGFTEIDDPELRVEATDCGGNTGVATVRFHGRVALTPEACSAAAASPSVNPTQGARVLRRAR